MSSREMAYGAARARLSNKPPAQSKGVGNASVGKGARTGFGWKTVGEPIGRRSRSDNDGRSFPDPSLESPHMKSTRMIRLSRKMSQPSNKCRNPSAAPAPNHSTSTPIAPIRNPFKRIAIGMLDRNSATRFHIGARNKYEQSSARDMSGKRYRKPLQD